MTGHGVLNALMAAWAASWVALPLLALAVLPAYTGRGLGWSPRTFAVFAVVAAVLTPLADAWLATLGAYLLITTPSTSRGGTNP